MHQADELSENSLWAAIVFLFTAKLAKMQSYHNLLFGRSMYDTGLNDFKQGIQLKSYLSFKEEVIIFHSVLLFKFGLFQ